MYDWSIHDQCPLTFSNGLMLRRVVEYRVRVKFRNQKKTVDQCSISHRCMAIARLAISSGSLVCSHSSTMASYSGSHMQKASATYWASV